MHFTPDPALTSAIAQAGFLPLLKIFGFSSRLTPQSNANQGTTPCSMCGLKYLSLHFSLFYRNITHHDRNGRAWHGLCRRGWNYQLPPPPSMSPMWSEQASFVVASLVAPSIFFCLQETWTRSWWKCGLCGALLAGAASGMYWTGSSGYHLINFGK
jgi:hypothetical protein